MAAGELDRLATGFLEGLGKEFWGFAPHLAAATVEQLGPARAMSWSLGSIHRYDRTLRALGPLRTQLVCMTISLYNRCRYNAYGHAYAAELIYFRKRGRLLPVDPTALSEWTDLTPGELRDRLCDLLQHAELHVEVIWIDRTLALVAGEQEAVDQDEARIAHLIRMFSVLDAVAVVGKLEPDEAHDPINKDTALKAKHAALRGTPA
jgi:hypothetical protein